jgi:hypothetical protein
MENMIQSGAVFGVDVRYQVTAKTTKDKKAAEIKLGRGVQPDKKLKTSIFFQRRTVKSNHLNRPLDMKDFKAIASGNPNFEFVSHSSPQVKELSNLTLQANVSQVNRIEAQKELADWIRWNNRDIEMFRDGITAKGMELPFLAEVWTRFFYSKDDVISDSFKEATIDKVKSQLSSYGGWIIVKNEGSSPYQLIKTGRLMQRMWLKSKEKSIAIHPMTQALEEPQEKKKLYELLKPKGEVQFVLRTSYVDSYPEPYSIRRPVKWFVS